MGTIASVLQWTCTNCNLINPTECLKCLNCGNVRRILAEPDNINDDDNDGDTKEKRRLQQYDINQISNNKCKTISDTRKRNHNTLPGYVEINSNGYLQI